MVPAMPRRRRCGTAGFVFHVINRAAGGWRLFDTDADYTAFLAVLQEGLTIVPLRILSYTLMPNHWHLVLWPDADDQLSEYLRWVSTTHAVRWHQAHGTVGRGALYQGRFKSFPVQDDDHFYTLCRYVERNALRANLVTKAELWRWSSLWQRRQEVFSLQLSAWPLQIPQHWSDWVNEPQTEKEIQRIRHSIRHDLPFGEETWSAKTAATLGLHAQVNARGRPRRPE